MLQHLKQATTDLFATLPREGLFYNEKYAIPLATNTNTITLPAGVTGVQVPTDLFIQETALIGVDRFKHLLARVDPRSIENTLVTGVPSGFCPLDDATIGFNAFADRPYTVTLQTLKQHQLFDTEAEVVTYPQVFIDYILYRAAALRSALYGFTENANIYQGTADQLLSQIQVAEATRRPIRINKGSWPYMQDNFHRGWNSNPY